MLKRRKEKNMNDVNPAFKILIQPLKNEITRKISRNKWKFMYLRMKIRKAWSTLLLNVI